MGNKLTTIDTKKHCLRVGCNAIAIPNTNACPLHICRVNICEEIAFDGHAYCMWHTCNQDECFEKVVIGTFSCRKHAGP